MSCINIPSLRVCCLVVLASIFTCTVEVRSDTTKFDPGTYVVVITTDFKEKTGKVVSDDRVDGGRLKLEVVTSGLTHTIQISVDRISSVRITSKPTASDSGQRDVDVDVDATLPTLPELLKQWPDGLFKVRSIGRPTARSRRGPDYYDLVWEIQQKVRVTKDTGSWNRFVGMIRKRLEEDPGAWAIKRAKWPHRKVPLNRNAAWKPTLPGWLKLSITNPKSAADWGKYNRLGRGFYYGLAEASNAGNGNVFVFVDKSLDAGWAVHASRDLWEQLHAAFASIPVPKVHVQLMDQEGNAIGQVQASAPTSQEGRHASPYPPHIRAFMDQRASQDQPLGGPDNPLELNGWVGGKYKAISIDAVSPYITIKGRIGGGGGGALSRAGRWSTGPGWLGSSVDLIFRFDVTEAEKDLALKGKVDVELR